jgi:hypothetical protein
LRRPAWVFVFCALLAPAYARAHDPFQITTDARIFSDRLDVRVTMAERTAVKICLGEAAPATLAPGEFEKARGAFESCSLYRLTAGGEPLAPSAVRVALTSEGDIQTVISFPLPTASPLVFDAVHLARLSNATYGAELVVTGANSVLGQKLLRRDDSTLAVELADTPMGGKGVMLLVVSAAVVAVGLYGLVRRRFFS